MKILISLLFLISALNAYGHCGTCAGDVKAHEHLPEPLFNGANLDDFIVEDGSAPYRVEEGVIIGRTHLGSPNTFLATKKVYGDFELTFQVKLDEGLNSGVQIRSRSNDKDGGRYFGPQVEIENGPGQAGYVYGEALGGWLSKNPTSKDPSVSTHTFFKNNHWNDYRIVAQGPRIRTYVNGSAVEDITLEEVYKTHPEGTIGLQVHSIGEKELAGREYMEVRWRHLKIREL